VLYDPRSIISHTPSNVKSFSNLFYLIKYIKLSKLVVLNLWYLEWYAAWYWKCTLFRKSL